MHNKDKGIFSFTKKLKILSLFFTACVLMLVGKGFLNTSTVSAGTNGWTIGDTGYVNMPVIPTRFGTNNYILGPAFLLQPHPLSPFAQKNGKDKAIKEIDAAVPRYTLGTVAIIPYDMNEYLKRHGFTKLEVIKRPNANSTKVGYYSDNKHMKAVIKMEMNISTKTTVFERGVYYEKLKTYLDQNSRDKLSTNWKKIVMGEDGKELKNNIFKSEEVWSYITRFNLSSRIYEIPERIDAYLHMDKLGIDPNDMTKASAKDVAELKLRYTDLLMTIYTQCIGSGAASEWESAITTYIKGSSDETKSKSNIAISAGILARGDMTTSKNKTSTVNIITGGNDFLDMTVVTDSDYSLGILSRAVTVEESLKKRNESNTYYNRLLESIRLSVAKQNKNNEKVERTYLSDSLWGSNIASRIIKRKPIISGNKVSYGANLWGSDLDYIETISLKKSYYGLLLVPAYDGPGEPSYTATLTVGSIRADFPDKDRVDVKKDDTLKDSPKLTIKLKNKDWKLWEQLIKANKNFKIQVAFTRTPKEPAIGIEPNTYVSAARVVNKDDLKDFLKNGAPLPSWNDSSLFPVPIVKDETKIYDYQATVTIFYSDITKDITKMGKLVAKTNKAKMTYIKEAAPPELVYGRYTSEPDAYSELKEGGIYNETFEAMAGVPSTRKLYFASGGSEFMVEVEVLYDKDKSAERTY